MNFTENDAKAHNINLKIYFIFLTHFPNLKLPWSVIPECFLPENLRGIPIDDLSKPNIEECMEFIVDEGHDAASTSHNFLEQGECCPHKNFPCRYFYDFSCFNVSTAANASILAFCALILFIIMAIIVVSTAICYSRHRARYYTNEEKRAGEMSFLPKHFKFHKLCSCVCGFN